MDVIDPAPAGPTLASLALRVTALQELRSQLNDLQHRFFAAGLRSSWCRMIESEAALIELVEATREELQALVIEQNAALPSASDARPP